MMKKVSYTSQQTLNERPQLETSVSVLKVKKKKKKELVIFFSSLISSYVVEQLWTCLNRTSNLNPLYGTELLYGRGVFL